MHLGSNLRKTVLEGSKDHDTLPLQAHRGHDQTDTLIYKFCNLLILQVQYTKVWLWWSVVYNHWTGLDY